jgi:hypothetical protein
MDSIFKSPIMRHFHAAANKDAFIEAIEEKRNVFYELIVDAIEDIAIVRAIREGEDSKTVSNQEIFNILEGQA